MGAELEFVLAEVGIEVGESGEGRDGADDGEMLETGGDGGVVEGGLDL